MTHAEISELLDLMAKHKVARIKVGEVEIEMSGDSYEPVEEQDQSAVPLKIGAEHGNPTDDEILYWSGEMPDVATEPPQ